MAARTKDPGPPIDCKKFLRDLKIRLQPKQQEIYDALTETGDVPTVLGVGGSRGSAKSGGIRRFASQIALEYPGIRIFIVRRVLGDLILNHVDEMKLEFPAVHELYHPASGGKRPEYLFPNDSKIILIYAETKADVDRLVKGQQAAFVFIDQAEQFSEDELVAFREVNRSPGAREGFCKICFFFNTAQGIGAPYFRRVFHTKRYRPNENPKAYWFMQVYGWDNYAWFQNQVPYSFEEFYDLSSKERFNIYIRDTSQGRKQNELSKNKRDADLLGNFDSFNGQYFADVWGDFCELDQQIADSLIQPWWTRWMAQRWGFGDHDCHLWAATGLVTPMVWKRTFGGDVAAPIEVVIIYRELLTLGKAGADLVNEIISMTPQDERRRISEFSLGSPSLDQQKKCGENTVGESFGKILRRYGLPEPVPADDHRVDGWQFMFSCLRQAAMRKHTYVTLAEIHEGPALFISSACPACIENIPLAVRDLDKEPNDVKVMQGEWPAVTDAVRFLLKSKPAAKTQIPLAIRRQMALEAHTDPTAKHMAALRFQQTETGPRGNRPSWRG